MRQAGRPVYLLLITIAVIVLLATVNSERTQPLLASIDHMEASAATLDPADTMPLDGPWSRIVGSPQFEKITDVAATPEGDLVFAALTLGMVQGEPSQAMLIRTSASGHVHAQAPVRDARLGSVSGGTLDSDGRARFIHWQGADPAFAMTDRDGTMIWSRTFAVPGQDVWADIAAAEGGETLAAIADGYDGESVRVVRLDEAGNLLWRHVLQVDGTLGRLRLADSGDGGAVLAYDIQGVDEAQTEAVDIVRINRRGRTAWMRTVASGIGEHGLADLIASRDGAVVLTSGASAGLHSYDALGELVWVRDAPTLAPGGRHVLARGHDGSVHMLAETVGSVGTSDGRRHWLARFDADGRLDRSAIRTNRMNATFEAVELLQDGSLVAAGSLIASSTGDTDMVMLSVAANGDFPTGYGAIERTPPVIAASMATVEPAPLAVTAPTVLAAAVVTEPEDAPVPGLPIVPSLKAAVVSNGEAAGSDDDTGPAQQLASTALAYTYEPPKPTQRTIATPEQALSASAVSPASALQTAVTPDIDDIHDYQCTFSCLADSQDLVKYPVSRLIRDVSEQNAALVSLDLLAMDSSVCSSTGGRVFDRPRLPPKCVRVD